MLKKILLLLSVMLPAAAMAQLGVGSWEVFPTFNNVDNIVETPSKVYALSAGTLMSYDMDTDESYTYGINNKLSEVGVSNIYYNPEGKYLVATYSSGGMDVIYDNGREASLPDIKDALLNVSPAINDISFANGQIFVSTNFGLVVYDGNKMEVKKTGIYEKEVRAAGANSAVTALYDPATASLCFLKNSGHINTLDNFSKVALSQIGCTDVRKIEGIGENRFAMEVTKGGVNTVVVVEYNPDTNTLSTVATSSTAATTMKPAKIGYYLTGQSALTLVDAEGNISSVSLPAIAAGQKIAFWDDPQRVWAGNADGIAQYAVDGGTVTTLHDKIKGEALTSSKIGRIHVAPNSGNIYFSHIGRSFIYEGTWPTATSYINVLKDGKISDVSIKVNGNYITSTNKLAEDPNDPSVYYACGLGTGLVKVRDGKTVAVANASNSPILFGYVFDVCFDAKGNLYINNWKSNYLKSSGHIYMLPADKLKKDTFEKSDWVVVGNSIAAWDYRMNVCKKSNIALTTSKWYHIDFIDLNEGNADYVATNIESFTDQDGREISLTNVNMVNEFFEDSRGRIWVGYNGGMFIIPDPAKFKSADFRVQHIKVARNDGTNLADYLLEGENVLCITEDSQGRKWIGTMNSGAYLVSENGNEIIEHFTPDNSYLPDIAVWAIGCDPKSNAVYFGTSKGLVKYSSDTAPGSDDYSDVYAYPNPVRPDYTGWITVKGLMDNSLVKIADAAGNVFFQGESNGGIITWDGCDRAGNRVKTGVYYVFASQSSDTSTKGAVTKILVVK